jgi:hypothetical protein
MATNAFDYREIMLLESGITGKQLNDFSWVNDLIPSAIEYTFQN